MLGYIYATAYKDMELFKQWSALFGVDFQSPRPLTIPFDFSQINTFLISQICG